MSSRYTPPIVTDALEREFVARRAEPFAQPLDFRRLIRVWHRTARAVRGAAPRDRGASRLSQLAVGLFVYGVSEALMLAPAVGVDPWDVFHTGLSRLTGIPVGTVLIVVGAAVMLLWIPLRQRPGMGTIANIVVIGAVVDVLLAVLPAPHGLWARWAMFAAGVLLNAVATGLYIGAGLGPGPRDGLTTGLAARGRSIRVARTGIELSVLAAGWLLGGDVGLGTLVYAASIGPLVHVTIPWFARREPAPRPLLHAVPLLVPDGCAEDVCKTPVAAA